MKASYDPRTDTLSLILKDGAKVAESDEDKPGVILDYDERGDGLDGDTGRFPARNRGDKNGVPGHLIVSCCASFEIPERQVALLLQPENVVLTATRLCHPLIV